MNLRYVCSKKVKDFIKENNPVSKEMSLSDFLTEEVINRFGIKVRVYNKEEQFFEILYSYIKSSNYNPEFSEIKKSRIKINKEEKISLVYHEFGIEIDILKNSVLYVPDFKLTSKLFILFNKILGFKQCDFRNYYTKILNFPEQIVVLPVILDNINFCGYSMYMLKSEAREYLDSYFNEVREYLNI